MYRFKESVPSEERARVMEVIKWNKNGLVYENSLLAYPEFMTYFDKIET